MCNPSRTIRPCRYRGHRRRRLLQRRRGLHRRHPGAGRTGHYDDFVSALVEQARAQTVGGTDVADADYGPLNSAAQLERLGGFFDRLPVTPRSSPVVPPSGPGYCSAPSVIAGLHQDDEVIQEELFGPAITVQRSSDEDEAIAWATACGYGLASSVWTQNHGRAMRMAKALDFGCVWTTRTSRSWPRCPTAGSSTRATARTSRPML